MVATTLARLDTMQGSMAYAGARDQNFAHQRRDRPQIARRLCGSGEGRASAMSMGASLLTARTKA
jgi:hypothetical protein